MPVEFDPQTATYYPLSASGEPQPPRNTPGAVQEITVNQEEPYPPDMAQVAQAANQQANEQMAQEAARQQEPTTRALGETYGSIVDNVA